MTWVAASIAGSAVVGLYGASQQARAAGDAAGMQADAANRASALSHQEYEQQRADAAPWREAGVQALGQLQSELPDLNRKFTTGDFNEDPGYAFRMQQGQQAIERSAAARGGLNSGATMKALTRYGQDSGSQEYQNACNRFTDNQNTRFNRLASLSGVGQTANSQLAASGSNMANQVGQNMMGAANANAAGAVGSANAINNGLSQGMNSWMQYSMMNRFMPQASSPSATQFGPTNIPSVPNSYTGSLGTIGE